MSAKRGCGVVWAAAVLVVMGCDGKGARVQQEDVARANEASAVAGSALDASQRAVQEMPVTGFADSARWHDGKAEVSRYVASRERYGKTREFEVNVVQVKEAFNPKLLIKSDSPGAKALPVMKTQITYTMPTDNYPYNFAMSVFSRRDNPFALVKAVATSHEWCGITTKHVDLRGEQPVWSYHSYFESESQGDQELEWPAGGVLEEQLLLAVRALDFKVGREVELRVFSRQLTSHATPAQWREATLRVVDERSVEDATGEAREVWHVEVAFKEGGAPLSYDIERDEARLLVHHSGPDGFSMRLKKSVRWAYWDSSQASPFTGPQ